MTISHYPEAAIKRPTLLSGQQKILVTRVLSVVITVVAHRQWSGGEGRVKQQQQQQ